MQPFEVPFGEEWTILRGIRDRVGDKAPAAAGSLERCVFWQNVPVEPGGTYPATARDSATLTGTLAVPKGSAEVKQSDQLRRESTGVVYQVLGPANWDHVHPMSGWDPGYVTYSVKAVT
ncbi:hypothetical protein IU459_27030 [Nocardia amamiensis]|uniref:Head-to-tail stopper n=1 Tax=Nocardia amamiensis TaxID=404578 RepID=A0ABS0CXG4_9NOCA|nr:hypothetical protein [Nocardia amamiensis]MBF6301170.1 hypothetical protein [Nocardia amamiensis]